MASAPRTVKSIALSLGHSIFTPSDTQAPDPDPDDRPYAGWLYGSIAYQSKLQRRLDIFELTLGVVGPSALGEQVQNDWHNAFGFATAKGWNHQLHDEPGVILTWERRWRPEALAAELDPDLLGGLEVDAVPHLGLNLGNVLTSAELGGEVRLGWKLPADFGTALIGPGGGVTAPVAEDDPRGAGGLGFHVFAGATAKAKARDIFLDGNTWEDSPHVAKEWLVGEGTLGAAVVYGPVKLAYTHVFRSKEFATQHGYHDFGAVSLSVTF